MGRPFGDTVALGWPAWCGNSRRSLGFCGCCVWLPGVLPSVCMDRCAMCG